MFQRAFVFFCAAVIVASLPLMERIYYYKLVGQLLCNGTSINGIVTLFENDAPKAMALSEVVAGEDGKFEIEGRSKLWDWKYLNKEPCLRIRDKCNGEVKVVKNIIIKTVYD